MKKIALYLLFTCLIVLSIPLQALAEQTYENAMEDLLFLEIPSVLTALKQETKLEECPGSVTVVTKKDIRMNGIRYLGDLINTLPNMQRLLTGGNNEVIMTRGGVGNIKVMLDGHAVNEFSDHGILNWYTYPMDNVKQVEIIRGPGSALYGTDAYFGVINIITEKESEYSDIYGYGGEGDYYNGGFSYNTTNLWKNASLGINFDYLDNKGLETFIKNDAYTGNMNTSSLTPAHRKKAEDSFLLSNNIEYKNLKLILAYKKHKIEEPLNQGAAVVAEDHPLEMYNYHTLADIQYDMTIDSQNSLLLKASYDLTEAKGVGAVTPPMYYNFDLNGDGIIENWPEGIIVKGFGKGEVYNLEAMLSSSFLENHNLIFGGQYLYQRVLDLETVRNFFTFGSLILKTEELTKASAEYVWIKGLPQQHSYAFYVQDIWDLSKTVQTVVGARYDDYERSGASFNPRAAILWKALKDHIVKCSYGKAFNAPTFLENYLQQGVYQGNPDLKPEEIETIEVSLENTNRDRMRYKLSVFKSYIKDTIVQNVTASGTSSNFNIGKGEMQGVELELSYLPLSWLKTWGNIGYNDTKDTVNDREYDYTVNYIANLGFNFILSQKSNAAIYTHFSGPMKRPASFVLQNDDINAWSKTNIVLNHDIMSSLQISLIAKNIFDDKRPAYPSAIPHSTLVIEDPATEGRQVIAGLRYEF